MFNYGMYGYPMMGGMGYGNMHQYFKARYGSENDFRTQPYWQEFPKPVLPKAKESIRLSLWQRFLNKIAG